VESGWEEERRKLFEERGWNIREMEKSREEGHVWFGVLIKADREIQRLERWQKIRESRYNTWFREIKEEGIPEYLRKGWRESRCRRMIRFRLGN